MNVVHLIGRVGIDPELHKAGETPVLSLNLATNYYDRNKKQQTSWHRVVFWDRSAEIVAQYVKKGDQLGVEGRLQTRTYNDRVGNKKTVTEVVVTRVHLIGGARPEAPDPRSLSSLTDEDIPF